MIITVDEARAYWAHPSQHDHGQTEAALPEHFEYRAQDGVCLAFHEVLVPGYFAVHIAAKPDAWGKTTGPSRVILNAFWRDRNPVRVVAWIEDHKRHAAALARRLGFTTDGHMPGVTIYGWTMTWVQ